MLFLIWCHRNDNGMILTYEWRFQPPTPAISHKVQSISVSTVFQTKKPRILRCSPVSRVPSPSISSIPFIPYTESYHPFFHPEIHLGYFVSTHFQWVTKTISIYPLVNVYITTDNDHFIARKTHHKTMVIFNSFL